MRCREAKRFLLPEAIKFYLKAEKGEIYRFMSLYDDNEPYPLSEVIALQAQKVVEIEQEAEAFKRFLLGNGEQLSKQDYQDRTLLAKADRHAKAMFLKSEALKAKQTLTKLNKIQQEKQ